MLCAFVFLKFNSSKKAMKKKMIQTDIFPVFQIIDSQQDEINRMILEIQVRNILYIFNLAVCSVTQIKILKHIYFV